MINVQQSIIGRKLFKIQNIEIGEKNADIEMNE